jgi:hypothetical protein
VPRGRGLLLRGYYPGVVTDAAAATACGNPWFFFDGFRADHGEVGSPVEGIAANIRIEYASLCYLNPANPNNDSSAWVMASESGDHAIQRQVVGGYAQDGFLLSSVANYLPYFFFEFSRDGCPMSTCYTSGFYGASKQPGEWHKYWVQWTRSCSGGLFACFALMIDSTRIAQSDFVPEDYWGDPTFSPWSTDFMGETHYPGSDMPGRPTGGIATVYNAMTVQDWVSNSFNPTPCVYVSQIDTPQRYGLNYPYDDGCQPFSIYTK